MSDFILYYHRFFNLAPNAYHLPPMLGPGQTPFIKGPEYSFGKDTRMKEATFARSPGPAAYMLPLSNVYMNKAPAYSMGSKATPMIRELYGPGPAGQSSHLEKYDNYNTPGITFGIRHSPYKVVPGISAGN